jgi:hypothetical protein
MMDRVELSIRFSGTAEEAEQLIQHTESWAKLSGVVAGITIKLNPVDEEQDPYVSEEEILEYAQSEQYGLGLGTKTIRSIGRYASGRNLIMREGVPAISERDGTYYIHEDLLKLATINIDDFKNLGEKSAIFLSNFFEHRKKSQAETE